MAEIPRSRYESLFAQMWDRDPIVARTAQVRALEADDDFHIWMFGRIADERIQDNPFVIEYDWAEKAFQVGLPGVSGFGVTHHGRGDEQTDRLLHALERVYRKSHPGSTPPGHFRP